MISLRAADARMLKYLVSSQAGTALEKRSSKRPIAPAGFPVDAFHELPVRMLFPRGQPVELWRVKGKDRHMYSLYDRSPEANECRMYRRCAEIIDGTCFQFPPNSLFPPFRKLTH